MESTSLHVAFTENPEGEQEYWIKLELVENDDSVSRDKVAKTIDSLYDVNACGSEEESEADAEDSDEPKFNEKDFSDAVKKYLDPNFCSGGDTYYEVQIKVYVSNWSEPYRLQLTNGQIISTVRKTETVNESITFNNATSATPSTPGATNISVSNSSVMGSGYENIDVIENVSGNTFLFDEPVSGSASIQTETTYDLVTIHVNNNLDGTLGVCTAIGFYKESTDTLDIEAPEGIEADWDDRENYCNPTEGSVVIDDGPADDITCFENVTYQTRCECSDEIANEWEEEVIVTCPERMKHCLAPGSLMSDSVYQEDGSLKCSSYMGSRTAFVGYVNCGETEDEDEDVHDPEFYKEKCCHAHSVPPGLPRCRTIYRSNQGGKTIDPEIKEKYKADWGNLVSFVGVSPKDNYCGRTKYEWNVKQANCCEEVPPLEWDYDKSAEVIADNSSALVFVNDTFGDGFFKPQYHWKIRGNGFYGNSARTFRDVTTSVPWLRVYTGDACGVCYIEVDDGCSTVTGSLRSTSGDWVLLSGDEEKLAKSKLKGVPGQYWECKTPYPWKYSGGVYEVTYESTKYIVKETYYTLAYSQSLCGNYPRQCSSPLDVMDDNADMCQYPLDVIALAPIYEGNRYILDWEDTVLDLSQVIESILSVGPPQVPDCTNIDYFIEHRSMFSSTCATSSLAHPRDGVWGSTDDNTYMCGYGYEDGSRNSNYDALCAGEFGEDWLIRETAAVVIPWGDKYSLHIWEYRC